MNRNPPLQVLSCTEGPQCQNSVETKGEAAGKCILCRLAPGNASLPNQYWKPINPRDINPVLSQEKRTKAVAIMKANLMRRMERDPNRQKTARLAAKAERDTEHNIIEATKNSGRSNRDGDHLVAGNITMDTKLQSTRFEPVVHLYELAKVQADARRAGSMLGCLTIRNKYGIGVVVMDEADFAKLIGDKYGIRD